MKRILFEFYKQNTRLIGVFLVLIIFGIIRWFFDESLNFLHELIIDMTKAYPGWILRIYHDTTINNSIICPIECANNHVDFCNASALGNLGMVSNYIPPKIWRFLPAGDRLVDIMA